MLKTPVHYKTLFSFPCEDLPPTSHLSPPLSVPSSLVCARLGSQSLAWGRTVLHALIACTFRCFSGWVLQGEEEEHDPLSCVCWLSLLLSNPHWITALSLWVDSNASCLVGCAGGSLGVLMWEMCLKSDSEILCSPSMAFCPQGPLAQLTAPLSGWEPARQLMPSHLPPCPGDPRDTLKSLWHCVVEMQDAPSPIHGPSLSCTILPPSQLSLVAWQQSNKTDHHSPA